MKQSKYNSIVPLSEDLLLLYNAFSDSFAVTKRSTPLNDLFERQREQLSAKGFIINEEKTEEGVYLQQCSKEIMVDAKRFILTINPTLDCNFSCWYCYEEKNCRAYMSPETLNATSILIEKLFEKYPSVHISFFGGEPLLCYRTIIQPIINLVDELKRPYSISFTTNGALLNPQIVKSLQGKSISNMQITLDGGKASHDKTRFFKNGTGSYERILQNIVCLLECEIPVTLRINYTQENISSIMGIAEDLKKHIQPNFYSFLDIRLHQVWQTANIDLTDPISEIWDAFHSMGFRVSKPLFNNVFSPCYADLEHSAVINYNGDVFKCTAIDFANTVRDGYLTIDGNIIWENESLQNRLNCRFQNTPCASCRIQPICNGGCSQKALVYRGQDYCVLGFDEKKKDQVILDRFKAYLQYRGRL